MARMNNGDALSELERQAESNRAELAHTVDELHSRVSPESLKHEAREYAEQTGRTLLGSIEAGARENPLAAIAVAGGLALPLWRLAASIPAPLLLIGAGLALSRSGAGHEGSAAYSHRSVSPQNGGNTHHAGVESRIREVGAQATQAIHQSAERVRAMASDTVESVKDTTDKVSTGAAELWQNSQGGIANAIQRNPLVIGGIVFAAGGLLAAALPVSRQENRVMGEASDLMKERAKDIADAGVSAARTAAGAALDTTSVKIRTEGLTPDVARQAVREGVSRMGSVVEDLAETGGAPTGRKTNTRKSTRPEKDNG